jgi:hypothetical protein
MASALRATVRAVAPRSTPRKAVVSLVRRRCLRLGVLHKGALRG